MTIKNRMAASANALVERIFEGDTMSVTLAAFEFSYQADMFAKVVSKESTGIIVVRGHGRNYVDGIFEGGKEVKSRKGQPEHWARNLKWEDSAK